LLSLNGLAYQAFLLKLQCFACSAELPQPSLLGLAHSAHLKLWQPLATLTDSNQSHGNHSDPLPIATETNANGCIGLATLAIGNKRHGDHLQSLHIVTEDEPKNCNILETLANSHQSHGNHSESLQLATETNASDCNSLTLADSNQSHGKHIKPLQIVTEDDPADCKTLKTLTNSNQLQDDGMKPLHTALNTSEVAENPCLYHQTLQ
jgi:hypothetical protein